MVISWKVICQLYLHTCPLAVAHFNTGHELFTLLHISTYIIFFRLLMHSDCIEELDLEDNWIGDLAGREILEALEHRKEGEITRYVI